MARVTFKLPRYKYEFIVEGTQVHEEDGDLLAMRPHCRGDALTAIGRRRLLTGEGA